MGKFAKKERYKTMMNRKLVAIFGLLVFTISSHTISLITLHLLSNGIEVPDYWQLGKFPSIVTSIEYFAWGICMGLAFLFSALSMEKNKILTPLKLTLFICSIFCLSGYFGSLINEHLWYITPIGYGFGTFVICIEILVLERRSSVPSAEYSSKFTSTPNRQS